MAQLLLAVDFDGTITTRDTLHTMVAQFGAPGAWDRLEPALRSGEVSVAQAIYEQFAEITADEREVMAAVLAQTTIRPGVDEFLAWADRSGHRVVILSAGFRRVIDAILENAGIVGREIRSNEISFGLDGARIHWRRNDAICAHCGHACKRHDVEQFRADGHPVIYVGDGMSDRCGAEAADAVFARASLAEYLSARGRTFLPFDDFHQVIAGAGRIVAEAA